MAAQLAIHAYTFIDTIGVNTHIDFARYGYQNLAVVEASINYLGLKNLRDSAQTATDAQTWLQVAQATGAKFDDYIAETSPAGMSYDLSFAKQLAQEGLLNYLEGGNEEDDAYPAALGNTLAITAQFQQQVYATGHALGLPVINMSFGAGWTAANNWQGHYGDVGDLCDYADYANAHTYPLVGQGTDWTTQRLNGLARLAAASRPVITTEIGWNESQSFGQDNIAKLAIQAVLDGMKNGNVKTYFYALYDDGSGLFGLMNQDGTAKPAGTAIHNLTTLLADTGANAATFAPGSLAYTLGGATANDNALLMQKSDGSYWLSLWNENDAAHNVTVTLSSAAQIKVFDPLKGTGAIQSLTGVTSATLALSDHPMLVEVVAGATGTTSGGGSGGSTAGTGTTTPPTAAPTPTDLSIKAPATEAVVAGAKLAVSGLSITDAWAASMPGNLTLNVWDSDSGTLAMGGQTAASGGHISLNGTLTQLNATLAGLSYTAGAKAGTDSITVDVWNQAGVEVQKTIGVTVSATPASTPAPSTTVTIAATDANPVMNLNSVTIRATAGNHALFIGGSHDVAILTGGTGNVQAYQGYNTITTGAGNDTIRIAGSENVVDAGAGTNSIEDSGTGNKFVMPGAGNGMDHIYGYPMSNGDKFDFTTALKGTGWDGLASDVGNYLHVQNSGNDALISISNAANGAASLVADLHSVGPVSLSSLLANSVF